MVFLFQIAVAYSHKENYQWAIQFLQLEKFYHEQLLTNLSTLQETWESSWRERKEFENSTVAETEDLTQKHIDALRQICKTHERPSVSTEQMKLSTTLKKIWTKNESLHTFHNKGAEEKDGGEEEMCEDGQEVEEMEEEHCEETPEEEEVKVEWPTGVPQASDKDLAKLSHKEGNSCPDGLVSILKRRRASLDGLPPPSTTAANQSSKRKVHFSEPEDGIEQDDVGGDSCLVLLLLCLVTVVISIGGTALYCTLVDSYSSICTDFTHNVDFYVTSVRRFFEGLTHWLP
ncbi:consortin, connexin sorting protein b isoform X2 [Gouania willdenowi]|uniref:consortin, connexin sorting protein b isoform X2 n=1 Tax=Gouania willdenowi TaxID=441366 RepID=UPI001055849E|nr:consortin-like isoform X2 [Gouania willdenowi]